MKVGPRVEFTELDPKPELPALGVKFGSKAETKSSHVRATRFMDRSHASRVFKIGPSNTHPRTHRAKQNCIENCLRHVVSWCPGVRMKPLRSKDGQNSEITIKESRPNRNQPDHTHVQLGCVPLTSTNKAVKARSLYSIVEMPFTVWGTKKEEVKGLASFSMKIGPTILLIGGAQQIVSPPCYLRGPFCRGFEPHHWHPGPTEGLRL
ncbi:hypothetical protein PoB_007022800 [Plakobranchus ocellatus]|uniref:Uncharacterized protein n=1 Tax=Plakobranchus ocellatus TaxID=259542 RepID=A0AAV4DHL9_9GAST|nr:hypothetical protein PoB_007022800 [Plakobranchus ocellatus]